MTLHDQTFSRSNHGAAAKKQGILPLRILRDIESIDMYINNHKYMCSLCSISFRHINSHSHRSICSFQSMLLLSHLCDIPSFPKCTSMGPSVSIDTVFVKECSAVLSTHHAVLQALHRVSCIQRCNMHYMGIIQSSLNL